MRKVLFIENQSGHEIIRHLLDIYNIKFDMKYDIKGFWICVVKCDDKMLNLLEAIKSIIDVMEILYPDDMNDNL